MSPSRPNRPNGVAPRNRAAIASFAIIPAVKSVSKYPGAIAFTRTPFDAQSNAKARTINSTPPFVTQYGTDFRNPTCPATELMQTTDPPPAPAITPPDTCNTKTPP